MSERVAYVAGPMTGIEEFNYPLFKRVTAWLRESKTFDRVVCPTECNGPEPQKLPWDVCLRGDLRAALDATDVVLLPGWERSKGATLEAMIHLVLNSQFHEISTTDRNEIIMWAVTMPATIRSAFASVHNA